jgi:hypothetical protein
MRLTAGRQKALLAAAVILLAPVYWIALHAPAVGLFHDDGVYVVTAKALATGEGYRIISLPQEIPQTKYPILFPLLLSMVWRVFPNFPENVVFLRLVPFAGALVWLWLAYLLVRRESKRQDIATIAALLTAASTTAVLLSSTMLAESVFGAFCMGCLLVVRAREDGAGGKAGLYAASVLASGAFLTRTIGFTLILAVAIALLRRRGWRDALQFGLLCLLICLPWLWWQASHNEPRQLVDAYYTAQNYRSWNLLFNFTWKQKLWVLFMNGLLVALSPVRLAGLPILLSLALPLSGFIGLGFIQHLLRRPSVIHLFLILYLAVVLCWLWPPDRFVAVVLPLVLFYAWRGLKLACEVTRVNQRWVRRAAVTLLITTAAFSGWALRGVTRQTLGEGVVQSRPESADNWFQIVSLLDWTRRNTPPDAIFLSNIDPTIYLYTGRKAIRGFYADPFQLMYSGNSDATPLGSARKLRETILQNGVTHVMVTPNYGYAEKPYLRRLLSELVQGQPDAFPQVMQAANPEYKIYRVDAARLAALSPFVGKAVDGAYAFGQGFQQSPAPAARGKGQSLLIGLLIGLGEKQHGGIFRSDVLAHGDDELHVAAGLAFLHGKKVQFRQLIRGLGLRKRPFFHRSSGGIVSQRWKRMMRTDETTRGGASATGLPCDSLARLTEDRHSGGSCPQCRKSIAGKSWGRWYPAPLAA